MVKRQQAEKLTARAGEFETANLMARSELMVSVLRAIDERGWTQAQAAEFLGVAQPRISDVAQGRVDRFSVDMLMIWLEKLGKDVSIHVRDNVFSSQSITQLALYVCGVPSDDLLANVGRLFGGNRDKFKLRVVDVLQSPSEATRERITSVPCLVKESPAPRIMLTGDLSSASVRWQLSVAERARIEQRQDSLDLQAAVQEQRGRQLDTQAEAQDKRQRHLDSRESKTE